MRPAREQIALLLLHIGAQVAFGLLLARAYLARENTLERTGHWIATKTTLERGVMGAFNFMRGGQSSPSNSSGRCAWTSRIDSFKQGLSANLLRRTLRTEPEVGELRYQ